MKNKFLSTLAAFAFGASALLAQDEPMTNKNGQPIMPVAGDIGLGFNAVPLLNFVGNSFNGNPDNNYAQSNRFVSNFGDNVIFGKYMLSDAAAIRGHLRLSYGRFNNKNFVIDDTKNGPDSTVTDMVSISRAQHTIGAGYEMRRGRGRLRGIYGAELAIGFGRPDQYRYNYGNEFGALNGAPTSTSWDQFGRVTGASASGERIVSELGGSTFGVSLRPFVGVEYFFAPSISIGSEFGWNVGFGTRSGSVATFESYENSTGNVISRSVKLAGSNNFAFDTDNFNGAIFLMFYF